MDRERKHILYFCFVTRKGGAQPLIDWLLEMGLTQEDCGLVAIDHMRDLYALYTDKGGSLGYKGVCSGEGANDVHVSSVPKGERPAAYLYFNKDGYSVYCKEYKSYWDWVGLRNELRYQNTMQHAKNYDAKNMMHVFRLLAMAGEIAEGKGVITKRPDRDFLLQIRSGVFDYEELLGWAEKRMEQIDKLYEQSPLPETPDRDSLNQLLIQMREDFYH